MLTRRIAMIGRTLAVGLVCAGMAMGQATPAPQTAVAAKAEAPGTGGAAAAVKPLAFEVVSIRQNTSPQNQMGPPVFGPTPDGYRMVNMPLAFAIMTAYVPQAGGGALFNPNDLEGLPPWVLQERYDIVAKVSDEDLPEWQRPAAQTLMLQAMLQAMLTERCKLAVHRVTKDAAVYFLTVGKGGPKFKETDPTVPLPAGVTIPGGAVLVESNDGMKMYNASMGLVTTMLSSMGNGAVRNEGRPVLDKTGLTGRYDIVIKRQDMMPPPPAPGDAGTPPDPASMVMTVADALGLKLAPGKGQLETLVIDHMEKPSEN
jgi:uncharacterized protein (TIGR03435 family)